LSLLHLLSFPTRRSSDLSLINLGLIQARTSAFDDAEASLKKAQSLDPGSITPLLALANLYERQRRWADAEKEFQAATSLTPKSTDRKSTRLNSSHLGISY